MIRLINRSASNERKKGTKEKWVTAFVHIVNLSEASYHFSFPFCCTFPCILPSSLLCCHCLAQPHEPLSLFSLFLSQGGNVDLCRVPHCLDPLRCGLRVVSLWTAGFSSHSVFSGTNFARKVSSHVQPNYLPGH